MRVLVTYKFKMDWINSNRKSDAIDFFRHSRAANSIVCGLIWSNFKLIQVLMYGILTCKYEKDPIKNSREKVATPFPHYNYMTIFFKRSRAAKSIVLGRNWSNFELIQAFMYVIVNLPPSMKRVLLKQPGKRIDTVVPIITLWGVSVAMETRGQFHPSI